MNDRKPICLSIATGIVVLWIGYFVIAAAINGIHPGGNGGDIGGYNLKGLGTFLLIAASSATVGFVSCIFSLWRREKYRTLAWVGTIFYLGPGVFGLFFLLPSGRSLLNAP